MTGLDFMGEIASRVYYTGAGIVMIGTGVRFLYRFIRDANRKSDFLDEMRDFHLPNIYGALQMIAADLHINLELKIPGQKTPQ